MSRPLFQKKRPVILATSVAALVSLGVLLSPQRAFADAYWDGTQSGSNTANGAGGDGQWDNNTTANWVDSNGQNPLTYQNAVTTYGGTFHFDTQGGTITLGDDISFGAISFDHNGYTLTDGGSHTLTADASNTMSITAGSGVTVNISAKMTGTSAQVTYLGTGVISLQGNADSSDYSGGTVIGSGGTGPTVIIGANADLGNSSGSVTMDGGTLQTTSNFSTSRTFNLTSEGKLAPTAGTILTLTGQVTGGGALTMNGDGTLVLANANPSVTPNNYSGGTNLNAGTISTADDGNLGSGGLNFSGGNLQTTADITTTRLIAINTTGKLSPISGTTLTVNGVVSGAGVLNVAGPGKVVLGATNTYSGGTIISGGTLDISSDDNLGLAAGGITFANGGTLEVSTNDVSTSRPITMTGSGTLSPDGGRTLTVSGQISGSGALTVGGTGTVQAGAASVLSSTSPLTVSTGATLDLNNLDQTVASLAGAGTVTLGNATLNAGGDNTTTTFSGVIQDQSGSGSAHGQLIKVGTGTLTLSGANTYSGATTINGGTLAAGKTNAFSSASAVTLNAGTTMALNGLNQAVGSISSTGGAGTIALGTGTLTTGGDNSTTTYTGVINGAGGLTKTGTGTMTLTGVNTYAGATTVGRGALIVAPTGSTPLLSSSSRLVLGGATADGGTFQLNGVAGLNTTQVMNGLTVNSSSNSVVVNNNGGTSTTLDLRGTGGNLGITHNGGSVDFRAASGNLSAGPTGAIIMTHQANDATGILGGWATVNNGADLASNDGSDHIVAYTGYTDINATGSVIPNLSTLNVRLQFDGPGGPVTLAAPTTNINTLTQNDANVDTVVDTGGGTLRLGANGGILVTNIAGPNGNLTIGASANQGFLTAGGNSANTAGTLTLNNSSTTKTLTINSKIVDNGTGVVSVVVAGTGTTVYGGNNTYTGSTTISSGTLQLAADNTTSASSTIVVNSGATFDLNGKNTSIAALSDGGSGGGTVSFGPTVPPATAANNVLTIGANNASGSFSGLIQDNGNNGSIVKNGTGTLTLSGKNNSYTGGTTLNAGRLNVNGDASTGVGTALGSGTLTINGGTLGTTSTPTSTATTTGTVLTNKISVNSDFSIATNTASDQVTSQNFTLNGNVDLNGATRTITGTVLGGQVHFGGQIINGGLNLKSAFTSDGLYSAFVFDAGNVNTYTGDTTVNAGVLLELKGSSANGAIQGNLDIEGNGVVWYGNGSSSAQQIKDTSTVTVNSTGNTIALASSAHLDGLELGNASEKIGTLNGTGTVGLGSGTLTVGGGNFSGVIEDGSQGVGGKLISTGALLLSGKNTYTGTTTVNGGTLQTGVAGALPSASAITVASGATLDMNSFAQNVGSITGSGTIQLGSATLTTGNDNTSTTFSGSISGTGGLTKVGTGKLTLSGANTFTGPLSVTRGTVVLTPSTGTPVVLQGQSLPTPQVPSLALGGLAAADGGTFELDGISGQVTNQVLNGLTINGGNNVVLVKKNGATSVTLDLSGPSGTAGITRNAGYVDFQASGGTLGNDIIILTGQPNTDGIIGAWATVNNGSDFAVNDGANGIVGLSTIAGGYRDIAATFDTVPNGAGLNVRINSAVGPRVSGSDDILELPTTTINTLTQNFTTASTIDLQGGTLQLGTDGGILITPGSASLTIGETSNSGTLTTTGGGTITFANNASSTLTINSKIVDNGTAPVSIRLTGSGTTVFNNANTYGGSTGIFSGTLKNGADNAIPSTSAVTINPGATWNLNNHSDTVASIQDGVTGGGAIALGSATLTTGGNNADTTFSGTISGASGQLIKVGTGTLTLSGNNTYTGGTTLANGGLTVNNNNALGTGTLTITSSGGPTTLGTTVAGTGVTLPNAVSVKGDFSVFTAPSGASGPGNIHLGGAVDLNGATRTITGLTTAGQVQFDNTISNGGINFNTVFTKDGDYVAFIFNGANTYTGKTTVNNGAFVVLQGTTADGGLKGDVDIEGNGVVDYLTNVQSNQIADTATVTVNSSGNHASGIYFGGLDLFQSTGDTINVLNGNSNGVVSLAAATLTLNSGTFNGTIFDGLHSGFSGGGITKVSTGTFILGGSTSYTGKTTISAGTIQANAAFATSNASAFLIDTAGTLDINKFTEQVGSIANGAGGGGTIFLGSGDLVTGFDNTSTTFSGVLKDGGVSKGKGGSLTKVGTGTLTLSGANTYTGLTWITTTSGASSGGTLAAGAINTIPLTSSVLVDALTTFDLAGFAQSIGSLSQSTSTGGTVKLGTASLTIGNDNLSTSFNGVIQDSGSLTKVGYGTQFLGGANTYTGATTVNKGTLGVSVGGSLVSAVTLNNTGKFDNFGKLTLTGGGTTGATISTTGINSTVTNEIGGLISADTGVRVNNTAAGSVGYVINWGTITGTGGVAVDAQTSVGTTIGDFGVFNGAVLLGTGHNTVILATNFVPSDIVQGSIAGTDDTLELAGSGVDNLNMDKLAFYEKLHKVGGGFWNLTGTGDFSGGTVISGGVINLSGNLVSNVRVEDQGMLTGTGILTGDLTNFGVVMPGKAFSAFDVTAVPGNLTVKGNYTQDSGGILIIQMNGAGSGQHSQISIGGHAQLGGTLAINKGGDLKLKVGQKVTFLTAAQGVSGTFDKVSNPFATGTVVVGKLEYDANGVALVGQQGSFKSIDSQYHLTANQGAVATALDTAASDRRAAKLISFLDEQPIKKLPGDFDKIAPEEIASVYRLGVSLSDVQARNIQRRTADLRAGASGFSTSGFQTNGSPNNSGGLAGPNGQDGAVGKDGEPIPNRRIGGFITGVGDFVHVGDSGNAQGYDIDTGGVTVGADYKLTPNVAVGVHAGYTGTNANLAADGRVLVNGGNLGVYGTYFTGGYYADAAVTGGLKNYSTKRAGLEGDAFGSTQGANLDVLVDTGYDWRMDALTIGPTASFQYSYAGIDGYTEHGSLAPLRYAGQHIQSIRTSFGLRVAYDWKVGGVVVRPEASLGWQHEYGDRSYSIESGLASGAGSLFSVSDTEVGRDSLLFGGGVAVLWNPRTSTYLYYDTDLLKKEYNAQSVSGGLRMNF